MDLEEFSALIDAHQEAVRDGGFRGRYVARVALKDAWREIEAERDALRASVDQLADTLKNVHEAVCATLGIEGDDSLPELVADWVESDLAAHNVIMDGYPQYSAWNAYQAARAPQAVPALTDEAAMRVALRIMANLEDRKGVLDGVDDDTKADIADEIAVAILAAPQPFTEPEKPEHAHDWRFSLQDHLYKCDCGETRGDYPFGAASFKD